VLAIDREKDERGEFRFYSRVIGERGRRMVIGGGCREREMGRAEAPRQNDNKQQIIITHTTNMQ